MEALGALQGIVPGDLVAVIPPIGLRHLAGKGHGYGDLGAAADVLGGQLGVLRAELAQGAGGQIEDVPPILVLDRPRVGFKLVDRDCLGGDLACRVTVVGRVGISRLDAVGQRARLPQLLLVALLFGDELQAGGVPHDVGHVGGLVVMDDEVVVDSASGQDQGESGQCRPGHWPWDVARGIIHASSLNRCCSCMGAPACQ